jgi:Fe-Mn family superoxide dismutase
MKDTRSIDRRAALLAVAAGGAALVAGCASRAEAAPTPAAPKPTAPPKPAPAPASPPKAGAHKVAPLPFDATKLSGLSERLLTSHHDNNYAGAVKNLNKVEEEIAALPKDTPPFVLGGLKQAELTFRNSVTLHELYFANLGGNGKSSGAIERAITDAYGSMATWETEFRTAGLALGGGSGWVVLGWDLRREVAHVFSAASHREIEALSAPLLVMDMYEHAYQMDYGAAAAKYVDAFFANVSFDEVNRRLERAQKASAALRG